MKCLRHSSTFGAALFAVLMASTLSARETDSAPLALDGATPWNVDYADDSCALMRGFGEEDQRVFLELRRYSPGNALRLVVASSQFSFTQSNPIVTIAPGEPEELEEVQRIDADEMHGFTASFSLLDQIRDPDIDQDIFENDRAERESEIYGIQIADAIDQRPGFHIRPHLA